MPACKIRVAACLLAALPSFAQEAPHDTGLVLRSTTRMVQVNVVVLDKQGRPVAGLAKEDFIVRDNGKPQEIAAFSVESKDKPYTPAAPLPPNVFTNRLEQRSGAPSSVTIILLDGLNTKWGDQMTAAGHVVDFLGQIQPGDRVALFGLSRDLRILHDYTSDSAALVETLGTWRGLHGGLLAASQQVSDRQPYGGSASMATAGALTPRYADSPAQAVIEGLMDIIEEEANYAEEMRIKTTLKALEAVANHVAGIPGRKNLVWVSSAFPLSMGFLPGKEGNLRSSAPGNAVGRPSDGGKPVPRSQTRSAEMEEGHMQQVFGRNPMTLDQEVGRTIKALNNANLAVYPVDARGLTTDPGAATNISTMKDLAARTGGRAYYGRNDLRNSIREAVADSSVTYALAYYPREQQGDGEFRNIKIKINRPGVSVRHRKGYFDLSDTGPASPAAREAALLDAVWSPLDATSIRLDARVNPGADGKLAVETIIDAASLTLDPRKGRWHGKVDVLTVQTDGQGQWPSAPRPGP